MLTTLNIESWKDWLIAKGLSDNTVKQYLYYLSKLEPLDISNETFMKFIGKYKNTVARAFLKNLLMFIKTAPEFRPELKAIAKDIDIPKVSGRQRQKIIEVLKLPDVYKISEHCRTERDKLMVLISFYGGLRESELCIAAHSNYIFNFKSLFYAAWMKDQSQVMALKITGKGQKERKVFIPNHVAARLINWIKEQNEKQKHTQEDPLFNISARRWAFILANASQKAIGRPTNPHLLRHSCNMWLKSLGWLDTERQKYMGHSDITSTVRYDHTTSDDLKIKFNAIQ